MVMKKYIQTSFYLLFVVTITLIQSCSKDLDVNNPNEPDSELIFSNPGMVQKVAQSSFVKWWYINTTDLSPRMAMWVMADQGTCSWANRGMYHLSSEPRAPFNNETSYTYASINENYWKHLYASYFMANGVVNSIVNDSMKIEIDGKDETAKTLAFALFTRGLDIGYLGLVYDQGAIAKNPYVQEVDSSFYPYYRLIDEAIASMDMVIQICNENSFTLSDSEGWISGNSINQSDLKKLASSYAARFLVYSSRTKEANDALDWNQVLEYAEDGITQDFTLMMDDQIWKSYFRKYTVRPGWARIDARIIHLLDESYPWRFPEDGHNPEAATSADGRLESDFHFSPVCNMKPERGYYHYSNYEYSRYEYAYNPDVLTGEVPEMLAYENSLFKAEAMARLGNIDGALAIINNGPRTDPDRGNLPDATAANLDDFLKILFYERDIELIQTGFGIAFFDMRRRDMLQKGTMLHFPVPGRELMALQLSIYTFGGITNADGVNTSNGGWFPAK
jgi:hypothetical protein